MKKNRIYIAGPMTGLPNYNFEAFDNAEKILKARGLEPMNPANIGRKWLIENSHREPNESEYQDILRQDKELLNQCSMIYLLRGWEKSRGAKIELRHALNLGLEVELERSGE